MAETKVTKNEMGNASIDGRNINAATFFFGKSVEDETAVGLPSSVGALAGTALEVTFTHDMNVMFTINGQLRIDNGGYDAQAMLRIDGVNYIERHRRIWMRPPANGVSLANDSRTFILPVSAGTHTIEMCGTSTNGVGTVYTPGWTAIAAKA